MTEYTPSLIVAEATHQDLATGFPIGRRFKSARVRRVCDGNDVHLGHDARADGRWRIYAFAPTTDANEQLGDFSEWMLTSADSPLTTTPASAERDAWYDVKVIYPQPHVEIDITSVPDVFRPRVGPYDLIDNEKVYAADPENDIFDERGIDRGGVVVVVRPDQYVAHVLPLSATDELGAFFAPLAASAAARA